MVAFSLLINDGPRRALEQGGHGTESTPGTTDEDVTTPVPCCWLCSTSCRGDALPLPCTARGGGGSLFLSLSLSRGRARCFREAPICRGHSPRPDPTRPDPTGTAGHRIASRSPLRRISTIGAGECEAAPPAARHGTAATAATTTINQTNRSKGEPCADCRSLLTIF
jgi:hypothetical protein